MTKKTTTTKIDAKASQRTEGVKGEAKLDNAPPLASIIPLKQKKHLLDAIVADNPDVAKDSLQQYYIERMIEAYLIDPDHFNKETSKVMKEEKKKKPEDKQEPVKEIVCITKVEAEESGVFQIEEVEAN